MEGCVCVCVSKCAFACVGKVEERENRFEDTSSEWPSMPSRKFYPPSSLSWALTADHVRTLTREHFSDSCICIVFIHVIITPFSMKHISFHFPLDHFHQHTGMLFDSLQFTLISFIILTITLIERPFYIFPLLFLSSILSWIHSNQAIWPLLPSPPPHPVPSPLKLLFLNPYRVPAKYYIPFSMLILLRLLAKFMDIL